MKSNIQFSSLKFEQFEKAQLSQNQLRSVTGGGDTSTKWTGSGGTSGTDINHGDGNTDFSDNTSSKKDAKAEWALVSSSNTGLGELF